MKRTGSALLAAGFTIVVATTAGCSSHSNSPEDQTVDVSQLDVGNFQTEPKAYGKPTSIEMAKLVEAMHIGNNLPLPMEIDPAAKFAPSAMGGAVRIFTDFKSSAIRSRMRADPDKLNKLAGGLISGFTTTGRSNSEPGLAYELDNTVILFNTEHDATEAARILATEESAATGIPIRSGEELGIPADAHVLVSDDTPGLIKSWKAVDRFVIFTYVYDSVMSIVKSQNTDQLTTRVHNSIKTIAPALQKYSPTPPEKLMELDVDPDGVLGLAMQTILADENQRGIPGVYNRQGGLQFMADPVEMSELFEEAGVDRVAWQGNFVYRAQDPASASKLSESFGKPSKFFRTAEKPQNLPMAHCLEYIGPDKFATKYYCSISFDRYATEVAATKLADVHQRISAQYVLLTKSE